VRGVRRECRMPTPQLSASPYQDFSPLRVVDHAPQMSDSRTRAGTEYSTPIGGRMGGGICLPGTAVRTAELHSILGCFNRCRSRGDDDHRLPLSQSRLTFESIQHHFGGISGEVRSIRMNRGCGAGACTRRSGNGPSWSRNSRQRRRAGS
jgi:hypothetical protein